MNNKNFMNQKKSIVFSEIFPNRSIFCEIKIKYGTKNPRQEQDIEENC